MKVKHKHTGKLRIVKYEDYENMDEDMKAQYDIVEKDLVNLVVFSTKKRRKMDRDRALSKVKTSPDRFGLEEMSRLNTFKINRFKSWFEATLDEFIKDRYVVSFSILVGLIVSVVTIYKWLFEKP